MSQKCPIWSFEKGKYHDMLKIYYLRRILLQFKFPYRLAAHWMAPFPAETTRRPMEDNCFNISVCHCSQEFGQINPLWTKETNFNGKKKTWYIITQATTYNNQKSILPESPTSDSWNPFSSCSINDLAVEFPPAAASIISSLDLKWTQRKSVSVGASSWH